MDGNQPWYEQVPIPALLRVSRNAYASAIRAALREADFDDIPRNGLWVLGGLARGLVPLADLIRDLQISKQAVGQMVDSLVLRGYLIRETNPSDRRRLTLGLSERGKAAAAVSQAAVERIDAQLEERIGPIYIAHLRETLAVLANLRPQAEEADEAE